MTDQQRVAELESKALPIPSRVDLFASAVEFFKKNPNQKFRLFHGTEYMDDSHLRSLVVAGTTLEPIDTALKAAGVSTDGTVGKLVDLQALDKGDVHALACDCHTGVSRVDGELASLIFQGRMQGDVY